MSDQPIIVRIEALLNLSNPVLFIHHCIICYIANLSSLLQVFHLTSEELSIGTMKRRVQKVSI